MLLQLCQLHHSIPTPGSPQHQLRANLDVHSVQASISNPFVIHLRTQSNTLRLYVRTNFVSTISEEPSQPTSPRQQPTTAADTDSTDSISLSMTLEQCMPSSGNNHARANLLFDEGSQSSFITQDLANTLTLKPYQISQFHPLEHSVNQTVNVAVINLLTLFGQTIPLTVLLVPRIATPIWNRVNSNVACLPHLQNLTLAHPLTTDKEFDISLLVGADHYWESVGDKIIRGDGPTEVESKLGYLLSGPAPPTTGQFLTSTTNIMMLTTTPSEFNLERFWDLESIGVTYTDDSQHCYT